MRYRLVITVPAIEDMRQVAHYISHRLHNKIAAKNLMLDARKAIRSLSDIPKRHPLVNEMALAAQGLRLFTVRNYLLFYIVDDENSAVHIVRFLYGGRDWASILRIEPPDADA